MLLTSPQQVGNKFVVSFGK